MMHSIVEFKMMVLEELLTVLSPNTRIFVTAASLDSKMLQLLLLILFRKVNLSFMHVGQCQMNFKILLLKILMLLDFLICGSRLFHSFIVEGKREFLKTPCFAQSWEIFSEFQEKYLVLGEGTS